MKRLFAFLAVIGILSFGVSNIVKAQTEQAAAQTETVAPDSTVADSSAAAAEPAVGAGDVA